MSPSTEEKIRLKAQAIGFYDCAFTDCRDFFEDKKYFEKWISEGNQSEMSYLERNREIRYKPSLIAEGCTHVVILLLNYHRSDYIKNRNSDYRISEYALGMDYHTVMRKKLHELSIFLQSLDENVKTRCCVDTAPVFEKAMAERAGLGWIGKNTLLTRTEGSKFFIGEIFTTLELNSDSPVKNLCGSCDACIKACPTSALKPEGYIDARLCLSCQTIERKQKSIPDNISYAMGKNIYGCDCCQNACPYNKKSPETALAEFLRVPNWFFWKNSDWENMKKDDFDLQFVDSAISRTGYEKMMENISSASRNEIKK